MRALGVLLSVAGAVVIGLGDAAKATAAPCAPRQNLEAILDDSASMAGTDVHRLRAQGLKLIMSTPGNEGKLLGAIEFGDTADSVFGPGLIAPGRTAFGGALDRAMNADHFGSNYNAAFELAKTHNPGADARLFVVDAGDNTGDYANGHRGGPPTYTIGLGFLVPEDEARLRQIAAETGGRYANPTDEGRYQAAINTVGAWINCRSSATVRDRFRRSASSRTRAIRISPGTRSLLVALSWADAADRFSAGRFRLYKGKKLMRRKPKVTGRRGKTFETLKVGRLRGGTLRYQLKATRLSKASTGELVTQASPVRTP